MSLVAHLFGKDIRGIDLAFDMEDTDGEIFALSPQFNLETQHDGRSARNWMKRV